MAVQTKSMAQRLKDYIDAILAKFISDSFPEVPEDKTADEYNRELRRGSMLIRDILTLDDARGREDEIESAREMFNNAQMLFPDRWGPYDLQTRCLFLMRNFPEAREANKQTRMRVDDDLPSDPEEAEQKRTLRMLSYHTVEGNIAFETGEFEQTIEQCLKALSFRDTAHQRITLIRAYSRMENTDACTAQLGAIQNCSDFSPFAYEFIRRIDHQKDFSFLRGLSYWPDARKAWEDAARKAYEKAQREGESKADVGKPAKGRRVAKIAKYAYHTAVGVWVANRLITLDWGGVVGDLMGDLGQSDPTGADTTQHLPPSEGGAVVADLNPIGALDLNPILQFSGELIANPLVESITAAV